MLRTLEPDYELVNETQFDRIYVGYCGLSSKQEHLWIAWEGGGCLLTYENLQQTIDKTQDFLDGLTKLRSDLREHGGKIG